VALLKEYGDAAIESVMEKIGQQFSATFAPMTWHFVTTRRRSALILGDTAEKEALMAVEKLRKVIAGS